MCYQVTERYTDCRCLYYKHAIDQCAAYGQRGHVIKERTVLFGYACANHSPKSSQPQNELSPTKPSSGDYSNGALSQQLDQLVRDSLNERFRQQENLFYNKSTHDDSASAWDSTFSGGFTSSPSVSEPPSRFFFDLDHIIAVMLQDQCLVEGWRIILETQGKKSARHATARLLERFANDLTAEASNLREKSVCRFLRRERRSVAKEILHQVDQKILSLINHQEPLDHDEDLSEEDVELFTSDTESSDEDVQAATEPEAKEMEPFVLLSDAFDLFKTNVANQIAPEPTTQGPVSWALRYSRILLKIIVGEPKIAPGMSRVRWTCHCGREMFDDFIETRPGALKNLEKMLNRYHMTSSANPEPRNPGSGRSAGSGFFDWIKRVVPFHSLSNQPALPQHRINGPGQRQSTRFS